MESKIKEQYLLEATNPDWLTYYFPKGEFRGQVVYECKRVHHIDVQRVLWINYIEAIEPGKGKTQNAIKKLLREHFDVRIVLPNEIMKHIAEKFGLVKTMGITSLPDVKLREIYALPESCDAGYKTPCDADCMWCEFNKKCKFKMSLEEFAYVI